MQVAHHYFENGIAYFTRRTSKGISMACANGEVAPFMGHNAFLRWSAIQDVAFVDPDDGVTKIWSESNVSEDFDMALRLQVRGSPTRAPVRDFIDIFLLGVSCKGISFAGPHTQKAASKRVCRSRSRMSSIGGRSTPMVHYPSFRSE
jgi:hypothetical protein